MRACGKIFQSDSKNDLLDAEQLARVARMDPKLLYPIEHRDRSARADLAVMRSRDALVGTRTRQRESRTTFMAC
jgi:transposase